MTKREAEVLINWGKSWFRSAWVRDDAVARDSLIVHVNNELNAIGFRLSRGYRNYDPVIRRGGRPSSY